jgi:hypothetical protein
VIPADHEWATRAVVANVIPTAIQLLDSRFPEMTEDHSRCSLKRKAG